MTVRYVQGLLILVATLLSVESSVRAAEWVAPATANQVANPLSDSETGRAQGKEVFASLCVACHGAEGKGDGVSGQYLIPRPSNLTDPTLRNESDGSLFWKLNTGRNGMPSYKAALSDLQKWRLVLYLRSLTPPSGR
jgi:mono/diheme cytochrome c family protein